MYWKYKWRNKIDHADLKIKPNKTSKNENIIEIRNNIGLNIWINKVEERIRELENIFEELIQKNFSDGRLGRKEELRKQSEKIHRMYHKETIRWKTKEFKK